jgi:hypothetical protein
MEKVFKVKELEALYSGESIRNTSNDWKGFVGNWCFTARTEMTFTRKHTNEKTLTPPSSTLAKSPKTWW